MHRIVVALNAAAMISHVHSFDPGKLPGNGVVVDHLQEKLDIREHDAGGASGDKVDDSIAFVPVAPLKPLQTVLGEAQDRIVLSRWLHGQAKRIGDTDPAFAQALHVEAKRFRDQAARRRTAFLKLEPESILKGMSVGNKREREPESH